MKKNIFLFFLFTIPFFFARADFVPSLWAYARDIVLPEFSAAEYVRVPLDREVASGGNVFRDIRVISESSKEEVPYQLVVEDASVVSAYAPSRTLDAVTDSAGRLMFILDLGQSGILHSRLNIESDSKNYRRQVSVYATSEILPHESASWKLLTERGYIFKFSDDTARFSVSEGVVSYPESSARYLRVVIESGVEGALRLSSAGVYRYAVESGTDTEEEVSADVREIPAEQATEVVADLGASGIPTNEIELFVVNSGNFSRPVGLFGSNDGQGWVRIGGGYLSQIQTAKFTGSSFTVRYPESTYRYYKVNIENFDDVALSLKPRARFKGVLRTVVFEAIPGKTYSLYYGNSSAYAPRYDLARYFAYLDTTSLREGSLGAVRENSEYVPPEAPIVPFTDRNKVLLNVTLAILVVLIGVFIFWYLWRAKILHPPMVGRAVPPIEPRTPEIPPVEKPKDPGSSPNSSA